MARAADAARASYRPLPAALERAVASARAHEAELLALPNVIAVRGGYKFTGGRITPTAAVVVAVDRKRDDLPAAARVPDHLPDGTPTDVTVADPAERLDALGTEAPAAPTAPRATPLLIDQVQRPERRAPGEEDLELVRPITYQPPAGVSLKPVTGAMTLTCHVAPDAGWRVLRGFLRGASTRVTLGMYDFTAPHVYRYVRRLLRDRPLAWRQTLGPHEHLSTSPNGTKANDKTEASVVRGLGLVAPGRFEHAFAKVGSGETFASAYHIKVAVRDGTATWLSSGNWQSSNLPVTDFLRDDADVTGVREYNREWNVVVEHAGLAATFERFLRHDFETAVLGEELPPRVEGVGPDLLVPPDWLLAEAPALRVFAPERFAFGDDDPLTVQPILTPDNYAETVLELLREPPRERLYFQNQSLNPVLEPTPAWAELLRLLAEYSREPSLDVRIVLRNIGPIRKKLESLQAFGFDMNRVRTQVGCHTKGVVIDSEMVLLGSHNWTDEGIQANRDASLLIRRPEIARYYERVFLHDWDRLARASIDEEAMPIPFLAADGGEEGLPGNARSWRRVPWWVWEEG